MGGGHVTKKEYFQFCFSYKISMNVTLEPRRHFSVLARSFLVGHSPLLVLLEWDKLDGQWGDARKMVAFRSLSVRQCVCTFLFVQLIKTMSIIFVVLSGREWWDTLPKKRIFSVLFLLQYFHECNLRAASQLLSTS